MDSIRVSEAPDPGSIPGETTNPRSESCGLLFEAASNACVRKLMKMKDQATAGSRKGFE